jgi:hypothetical protein
MKTNMMELSSFVKWSVFGDGYVGYATHNTEAHYSVTRSPEHEDYIQFVEGVLSQLPDCKIRISTYERKDNHKTVLSLNTTSHPLFSRIRERQYIEGHRVIDPHMLTVLDWKHLALLYIDDGSLCFNNKAVPIVRLSTCAYSYFEQIELARTLKDKFGLIFYVNKSGRFYQLNLARKSMDIFFDGISKFKLPSYAYKFPESLQKETPDHLVEGGDLVYLNQARVILEV